MFLISKWDGMSTTNPSKVCADRIQFQLTLHKEPEEDNQGTSESFDSPLLIPCVMSIEIEFGQRKPCLDWLLTFHPLWHLKCLNIFDWSMFKNDILTKI